MPPLHVSLTDIALIYFEFFGQRGETTALKQGLGRVWDGHSIRIVTLGACQLNR